MRGLSPPHTHQTCRPASALLSVSRECPLSGQSGGLFDGLLLAGQRPWTSVADRLGTLHLGLFRNFQGIVDVDAEIPDGALQLAVPQQQLDDSQILGAAVDQRRLGPPHRVRTVRSWIKHDGLHPPTNDSCVLASGQVRGLAQAAGEEVIVWPPLGAANPTRQRLTGLFGDLELDWPLRLSLHNDCPRCNASAMADIADSQSHEIARPELAIDREIEECKFTGVSLQLKPNPYCPDLALLERCLLAHKFALVPGDMVHRRVIDRFHTCLLG